MRPFEKIFANIEVLANFHGIMCVDMRGSGVVEVTLVRHVCVVMFADYQCRMRLLCCNTLFCGFVNMNRLS